MRKIGEGREAQQVQKEIAEGQLEYEEGQVAEFAGEKPDYEDDYGWEPNKPEVSEAESRINLEAGIEAAKEIIEGVKGDFVGARFSDDFYGYSSGSIMTTEEAGIDQILEKLAHGRDWSPLYDDTLAFSGRSSGDGSHFRNFIGGKEIDSSDYSRNTDAETFYYVGGKPVTAEDYQTFRDEVRKMLAENYKNRGAEETWKRQLPEDIKEQVKKMRFDRRTEQVLEQGKVVPAGKIQFRHIYGSSHFGSGGGYGSVNAFELSAWKKGERVKKEVSTEDGDNGFMSGPVAASIEPDTIIIAKGGDCIGREGRSWEEIYICE
jgi:hypothetical protein